MFFMGTYTPKLDEKGRLILPAKFRDRLSEGLVVTQGQEKCLDVFPSDVFMQEAERARAKGMTSRSGRRPLSFYLLAAFFTLFVLFLYGPMTAIYVLSFQGPTGGLTFPMRGFSLRFFGGTHAEIHSSIPLVDNVGVMVDDAFYYPGDSYAVPDRPVELLATPCGAPWLKIGEAMDFVLSVAPRRTFATHEQPISAFGLQMANDRIAWAVEQGGGEHHVVEPGAVLTV